MEFTPDEKPETSKYAAIGFEQAYFEDGLAGYATTQSVNKLESELLKLLKDAGARKISLIDGKAIISENKRPAYQLTFEFGNVEVRIIQVALPVRRLTDKTLVQSKRQALYHLLNEVRFELERRHFHPDYPAFVPYMLPPGQTATIAELLMTSFKALPAPENVEVIDSKFEE